MIKIGLGPRKWPILTKFSKNFILHRNRSEKVENGFRTWLVPDPVSDRFRHLIQMLQKTWSNVSFKKLSTYVICQRCFLIPTNQRTPNSLVEKYHPFFKDNKNVFIKTIISELKISYNKCFSRKCNESLHHKAIVSYGFLFLFKVFLCK